MDTTTVRATLAAAVERSGKSHRKIAEEAGFAHTLLTKFLNGTTNTLAVDTLQRAAPVLGTTVGALLGEEPAPGDETLKRLDPWLLFPSPLNPRRCQDTEAVEALASSIEKNGLLQNLVVRPMAAWEMENQRRVDSHGEELQRYWIVSGERRWRAIEKLRFQDRWPVSAMPDGKIPCRVLLSPTDHADAAEIEERHRILALLENLQREDLPPLDEALAFQTLETLGWKTETVAQAIHKTQRYVQQRLALLKLMPASREALARGDITVSQARAIARANPSEQPDLLKRIERGELETERQIDEAAKEIARRHAKPEEAGDGRVRLASPDSVGPRESESGDSDEPEPPMTQEPVTQKPAAGEQAIQPYFEVDDEVLRFKIDFIDTLAKAIEPLLPPAAESGAWLRVGHPDLLPEEVHLVASEGAWTINSYRAADGLTYTGSTIPSGRCETFLRAALRRGLQILPAPVVVATAEEAEAAGLQLPQGTPRAEGDNLAAATDNARRAIADLVALQVDKLSPLDARLLAGRAISVARANLRIAVAYSDSGIVEANEAFEDAVEQLTEAVVSLARREHDAPADPRKPLAPPASERLELTEDQKLDIPDFLRRKADA